MGDIKKLNKFDNAVEQLNEQEELENAKSKKVVKSIAGQKTAVRGRKKLSDDEKRKTLPIYIPMHTFEQFEKINKARGISNNAATNMLIKDYITENKNYIDNE